jgi:pimeloyl-ACP methyl ester carboxylesterase
MSCTIVLVHGAFAESSSWARVIEPITDQGHRVVTAPNPLRGVASDAAAIGDVVRVIDGPVLLVAHSYGGAVISNVDAKAGDITGLVYVNGFAPAPGEHCFGLAAKYPGSQVGEATVRPVPRSDGTTDLYLAPEDFNEIFCPDLSAAEAGLLATTQRPATQQALTEPTGDRPLWRDVPSWFLIGEEDNVIPPALQRFMAERAGARRTVELPGASHAAALSQPRAVIDLILEAAHMPAAV